jgi:PhzF family phenazine biosynthesis protein
MSADAAHLRVFHVDAFATRVFAGNPAAVVLTPPAVLEGGAWAVPLSASCMQRTAAELGLPTTAFVARAAHSAADPARFLIRWFTPLSELALCGHATLGRWRPPGCCGRSRKWRPPPR